MNNLKQKNIDNLISLWKTVGSSYQRYTTNKSFSYCQIPNSEWPNRIWFNKEVDEDTLEKVAGIIKSSPIPLSVSSWSNFDNKLHSVFGQFGFSEKSQQIGMSLKLTHKFEQPNRLELKRVTEPNHAKIWAELYPQSFGYGITEEIVNRTKDKIQFYLIYKEQQAIGTAITHDTGGVIGIHGMGIVPLFRKQGFAREAMTYLLNKAITENKKLATLQSSAMGKSIYKNMGFTEDFLMTTYELK